MTKLTMNVFTKNAMEESPYDDKKLKPGSSDYIGSFNQSRKFNSNRVSAKREENVLRDSKNTANFKVHLVNDEQHTAEDMKNDSQIRHVRAEESILKSF